MKMSENNRQLLRKQVFNSSFEKKNMTYQNVIIRTEKDPIYHCLGFWQNNI